MAVTESPLPMQASPPDPTRVPDPRAAKSVPEPNKAHRDAVTRPPRVHLSETPSLEDEQLVGQILQLFSKAREARRPLVRRWRQNYRILFNRYWNTDTRPGWMPSPQVPEIFPIVAALVGWQTDSRITYTVAPSALPHSEFQRFFNEIATDLETVMQASYYASLEENEVTMACWDGAVYGTGIFKTSWEDNQAGGLGDAVCRRVNPFHFYPDPQAASISDANYFVEAKTMSVQELDRRFPGAAALFSTGGVIHDVDQPPSHARQDEAGVPGVTYANPGAISPATSPRYNAPGSGRVSAVDAPGVTVLEAWIREHSYDDVTDTRTGKTERKVADGWRVVVVAGNRVLMNEPAEALWSHGTHPYDRYCPLEMGEFWGVSIVELLSSPQKAINRILAALQQNVELTGNPVWKDPTTSGLQRQQMTNRPGQRVTVAPASAQSAGWVPPPNMQPAMMDLLRYFLQRMEAVSGLSAVAKGNSPSGRPSQGVVDAMQESSFVRVRMMLRNLEYALRGAGDKKASLIVENYTTPRIVSIAGPRGERTSTALKGRHFMLTSSDGYVPMRYQLMVDVGSRRHTSRAMREDRAVQLYTLGAIDDQALLDDLDYPNAQVVAERVTQQRAMAALAEPGKRERARA